ncbi:uncharacterized protein LOC128963695 [Oppia nitens]|uniref:uncharacterized protein LOC128963695 n=1 Tax=Oppia nitens TaxID=1686743 RepID=UPI0023DAE3DB|nr:uncharacterized protein LOC128963695 [Oppia nitens]
MAAKYVDKVNPIDEIKSVLNDLNELNEEVIEFKGTDRNMKYRFLNDMLSRCMTRLYTIDTDGGNDDGVRMARRAAVVAVQKCIDLLEKKLAENNEKTKKLSITDINDKPIAEISTTEPIAVAIDLNDSDTDEQVNDLISKFEKIDQKENDYRPQITLLLLGESGVGKSTFINAFVNYLLFNKMDDAIKNPICLIPTKFTHWEQGVRKVCTFGTPSDTENNDNTSESATQYPRCYTFDFDLYRLNIIDTPGIADTKGLDKDNRNMQNILNFISNYDTINGICVLLKPNEARVSVIFKYCILELLSHLNKSAADNIMFVFTNARSTFYAPGDTTVALDDVLQKVRQRPPYVRIKSVNECLRMIRYIFEVKPHIVRDTLSINSAKRTIKLLTQPLADISKNIADNIKECQKQTENILKFKGDIEDLKRKLYIPVVEIKTIPLDHPMTVCSDNDCCILTNINGQLVKDYKQKCHDKCYLKYDDGNIMGNTGLLDCQAFNIYKDISFSVIKPKDLNINELHPDQNVNHGVNPITGLIRLICSERVKHENCQQCGHSYKTHLHVKYETRKVDRKRRDESKYAKITTNQKAVEAQQEIVRELIDRQLEYENESKFITDCMAKFAAFLKLNAMTPFNDAFEDYVKHLIRDEEYNLTLESGECRQSVDQLKSILKQYQHERDVILESMKRGDKYSVVNLEDIDNCVNKLYNLPLNGKKIQELLNMQLTISDTIHANGQQQRVIEIPVNSTNSTVKLGKSFLKALKNFYRKL